MRMTCREDGDAQALMNWLSVRHRKVNVFLNGEKVKFAVAFDDEEGWVDRDKSIDGVAVIVNGSTVEERVYGKVTYEIKK